MATWGSKRSQISNKKVCRTKKHVIWPPWSWGVPTQAAVRDSPPALCLWWWRCWILFLFFFYLWYDRYSKMTINSSQAYSPVKDQKSFCNPRSYHWWASNIIRCSALLHWLHFPNPYISIFYTVFARHPSMKHTDTLKLAVTAEEQILNMHHWETWRWNFQKLIDQSTFLYRSLHAEHDRGQEFQAWLNTKLLRPFH